MKEHTATTEPLSIGTRDVLTGILREGAQQMPAQAIEQEVQDYLAAHQDCRDGT